MEIKRLISGQWTGQNRSQHKFLKVYVTKWKWKHNNTFETFFKKVLQVPFIALYAYIQNKTRRSTNKRFNDATQEFRETEDKPKFSRWQEIKTKVEINEIKN